jgi:hypothetical protein
MLRVAQPEQHQADITTSIVTTLPLTSYSENGANRMAAARAP